MQKNEPMRLILAQPRGFCAGVDRAISIVERALTRFGAPIYVRHEIVHNQWVVDDLKRKGVVFVEELDEVPAGAVTIFSAHGTAEAVERAAKARSLPVIDATCPLVTKVHNEAKRYALEGRDIVLIGHAGHPEVEGTSGRVECEVYLVSNAAEVTNFTPRDAHKLAYVTQTTLSVDDTRDIIAALKARFPDIKGPDVKDICYATQNRQNAVRELAAQSDVLLVIGASNSSNSNRLRDLGEEMGVASYLIPDARAIDPAWFAHAKTIGVTAGASAPEHLVEEVVAAVRLLFPQLEVATMDGIVETVRFKLPAEVADAA